MFKHIKLIAIFFILLNLTACATQQNTQALGPHSALLESDYLSEEKFKTDKFEEYCSENKLDSKYLFIYEATYKIASYTGKKSYIDSPIMTPEFNPSIVAVYSTLPLTKTEHPDTSPFLFDVSTETLSTYLKKTDEITVTYLMNIKAANYVPQNIAINKLYDQSIQANFNAISENAPIIELSNEIASKIDPNSPSSLNELVSAYTHWISCNIAYPVNQNEKESLRRQFINIDNPIKTLSLKLGVCQDNVALLSALLQSQGIKAEAVDTIIPNSLSMGAVMPQYYTPHRVTAIPFDSKVFLIDPTGQDTSKGQPYKLPNGQVVQVGKLSNSALVEVFPTYPTEALTKSTIVIQSPLSPQLKLINTIKLK